MTIVEGNSETKATVLLALEIRSLLSPSFGGVPTCEIVSFFPSSSSVSFA